MRLALVLGIMLLVVPAAEARTLNWSGRDWYIRQSSGLEAPGPPGPRRPCTSTSGSSTGARRRPVAMSKS